MRKLFIFIIISLFISACTLKKVEKRHGIYNLKNKSNKLQIFQSNTNDTISKLGIPSTKSTFDNNIWIYMERQFTSSELKTLGKEKLLINDVLVLKFDNRGLLIEKQFLSMDEMNNINVSADETQVINKENNIINTFIKSILRKINDPLGVKKAK